jgi:chemosensory pili system protein ChpA (sensor histidine kinase/response regulator)
MQALIVEAAGERFALPAVQIVRAVPRGVGHLEPMGDKLIYRLTDKGVERVYPALNLAQAVGLSRSTDVPPEDFDVVIVRIDDKIHALAVEHLLDSRELLVKSPGRYAKHIRGVVGLSILGDGGIAVNLDLTHLLSGNVRKPMLQNNAQASMSIAHERALPTVLIVDDSLSVRNTLLQLTQDAGYRARTARDGIEAIETLKNFRPDMVLTDLEMPNLNGVELTSHIKRRTDMKGVPVIMITSRSQEKHRRMAEQAGVDAYITKPYNEVELLEVMRSSLAA